MEQYDISIADFQDMLEKEVKASNQQGDVGINQFPAKLEEFLQDNPYLKAAGLKFGIYNEEYAPCFAEIYHEPIEKSNNQQVVLWRISAEGMEGSQYEVSLRDLVLVAKNISLKDACHKACDFD